MPSDNKTLGTRALAAAVALTPAAETLLLLFVTLRTSLTAFKPYWSDEIAYWRETQTFLAVGFRGGHYTLNELLPSLGLRVGGTHGPFYPIFVSTFGRVLGWKPYTPVIVNLFAASVLLFVAFLLLDLGRAQLLAMWVSLLSFWPLLLYMPTAMQTAVHVSLGILMAALVSRSTKGPLRGSAFWAAFSAISIASLVMPYWSVLFVPLFLASSNRWVKIALPVSLAVFFFTLAWVTWAPFSGQFVQGLADTARTSLSRAANSLASHSWDSLLTILALRRENPLQVLLRYQVLLALAFAIYYVRVGRRWASRILWPILLILLLEVALLDVGDWRDFRVLAPFFAYALAIFIKEEAYVFVSINAAAGLALVFAFMPTFTDFAAPHFTITATQPEVLPAMPTYQEGGDPWSNTVAADYENYTQQLLPVPGGIGITLLFPRGDEVSRSRYVLVTDAHAGQIQSRLRLKQIVRVSGTSALYENLGPVR